MEKYPAGLESLRDVPVVRPCVIIPMKTPPGMYVQRSEPFPEISHLIPNWIRVHRLETEFATIQVNNERGAGPVSQVVGYNVLENHCRATYEGHFWPFAHRDADCDPPAETV